MNTLSQVGSLGRMMYSIRIYLPPLELATSLLKTLITLATTLRSAIYEGITFGFDHQRGLEYVEIECREPKPEKLFVQDILKILEELKSVVEKSGKLMPLITRRISGSDYNMLSKIMGNTVIDSILGKHKKREDVNIKLDIYTNLLDTLRQMQDSIMNNLGDIMVRQSNKNLSIIMGASCRGQQVSIPRAFISDTFYECGRFGGIKDVSTRGPPKIGKVDIDACKDVAALMTTSLLAFNVCSEVYGQSEHHLFVTLNPVGVRLSRDDYLGLGVLFMRSLRNLRLCSVIDDAEVLRHVVLFKLYSGVIDILNQHPLILSSQAFSSTYIQLATVVPTAIRFYRDITINIPLGELNSLNMAVETLGLGRDQAGILLDLFSELLIATTKLGRVLDNPTPIEKLKHELKMLSYAITSANPRLYRDSLYNTLRILEDREIFWKIVDRTASGVVEYAQAIGVEVERYLDKDYMEIERVNREKALLLSIAKRLRYLLSNLSELL